MQGSLLTFEFLPTGKMSDKYSILRSFVYISELGGFLTLI